MIERNKRLERGSLFSWSPEINASARRLLRQDLKPVDHIMVEFAVSVAGESRLPPHSGSGNARSTDVC